MTKNQAVSFCFLIALAFFFKSAGAAWDASYHYKHFREFYQLPHLLNGLGDLMLLAILPHLWRHSSKSDRGNIKVIIAGVIVFIGAIGFDQWWHDKYGLDLTTWSPAHFALYLGTFIALIGAFRFVYYKAREGQISQMALKIYCIAFGFLILDSFWFPLLQQEQSVIAQYKIDHGISWADPDLIAKFFSSNLSLYGNLPAWLYSAWAVMSAVLIFHFIRKISTIRFGATLVATKYVLFRTIANLIFIYVQYPTSTVPYYLIAAGLLFDIVYNMRDVKPFVRDCLSSLMVGVVVILVALIQTNYPIHPPMPLSGLLAVIIPAILIGYLGSRILKFISS